MNGEKMLAERICNQCAKSIVDELGGYTLGGISLGEEYAKRCYREGVHDIIEVSRREMALRHWVSAVGYGNNGEFEIFISNYIQNC